MITQFSYENAPGIFMCQACCQRHYECFHSFMV